MSCELLALTRVRELSRRYDDPIPVSALRAGFQFRGTRGPPERRPGLAANPEPRS